MGRVSVTFLHSDHLGRPQFATNDNGQITWDGGITTPFGVQVTALGAQTQALMFPGQYEDAETTGAGVTLSHNWHRTYDPTLGRYLQSDPIGLAGGLNRYAYVGGNPVNLSDFSGLQSLGGFYDGYQLGQEYQSLYLNEQHNHLDAARHSEWNKAMVENCAPGIPWIMGRLNEARGYMDIPKLGFHKNIPAARYMDLHNNREGRRAGLENRPINVKNLILWAANTPESAKKNRERFKCDCDDTQFFTTKLRGPQQDKFTNFGDPSYNSDIKAYGR